MSSNAPEGWRWLNSWSIDSDKDLPSDSKGFQYSNDFVKYFSS